MYNIYSATLGAAVSSEENSNVLRVYRQSFQELGYLA